MRLCEDCVHFAPDAEWGGIEFQRIHAICARTSVVVRGGDGVMCREERSRRNMWFSKTHCGPDAIFFEPKV